MLPFDLDQTRNGERAGAVETGADICAKASRTALTCAFDSSVFSAREVSISVLVGAFLAASGVMVRSVLN